MQAGGIPNFLVVFFGGMVGNNKSATNKNLWVTAYVKGEFKNGNKEKRKEGKDCKEKQ